MDKHGYSFPTGSYAYNAKGVKAGEWVAANDLTLGLGGRIYLRSGTRVATASEGQIEVPSEMFAIGESRWRVQEGPNGAHDYMLCGFLGNNTGVFSFDPARHGKKYNQLFCDGHVSAMSPWVLFNPTNTAAMWNYDHQPHPELWPPF